jgi:hypothetical protein
MQPTVATTTTGAIHQRDRPGQAEHVRGSAMPNHRAHPPKGTSPRVKRIDPGPHRHRDDAKASWALHILPLAFELADPAVISGQEAASQRQSLHSDRP